MDGLAGLIEPISARAVLVLAAGAHPEEAAEQATGFARLGIQHFLPTRLDATRRLGSVLAAADTGLILTEAGIGMGATDGLAQITPEMLAERLLAPTRPAAATHRTPVFPTARSRAAQAWDTHAHG
jgi:flagellar biosynthesis protein FlhF